jgi:hypothetical protein
VKKTIFENAQIKYFSNFECQCIPHLCESHVFVIIHGMDLYNAYHNEKLQTCLQGLWDMIFNNGHMASIRPNSNCYL